MRFVITKHAEKRMIERNIPHPDFRIFKRITGGIKKKLKASCPKNKYKFDCVYFVALSDIYVCRAIDVNVFKLITVFSYKAI